MLYVVLRPFTGGGINLKRGDVIDEELFGMPYGRAEQLASQRYLRLAPEGAKHTVVPDPTLVAGALRPDGDAGFDTEAFVKSALKEEAALDAVTVEFDPEVVPDDLDATADASDGVESGQERDAEASEPEPESASTDAPAPAQPQSTPRKRKG